jgi:hypothetical protein
VTPHLDQQTPQQEQQHSPIYLKVAQEFPELIEDNERVTRGEKPQTEVFKRTGRIFSEALGLDPSLENSLGAVLLAARLASMQLADERRLTFHQGTVPARTVIQ